MQEGAFLIIDIDDFKSINDTYGHLYGDEVLIKIANAILISAGMEDYAGRIGGDEFCVFCRGENAGQHAMETAERISRMADRIHMSGRRVTLSMGISRYPEDASSYEELYQKADQALYRVKRSGKMHSACTTRTIIMSIIPQNGKEQTGRPVSGRSWRNIIKDVSGQKRKVKFCLL